MRFTEGLSPQEREVSKTRATAPEQEGLLKQLGEHARQLDALVARTLERLGHKMLAINPKELEVDLRPDLPTEHSAIGREHIPTRWTPEDRAHAVVDQARYNLTKSHGRMMRLTGMLALLAGGVVAAIPAAEEIGEARGAIEALRSPSEPTGRTSIGRFIRNAHDVIQEGRHAVENVADQVSDQIEHRHGPTETERRQMTEQIRMQSETEFNNQILKHAAEIGKAVFENCVANQNKQGVMRIRVGEYINRLSGIEQVIKHLPEFQQFESDTLHVSDAARREIIARAYDAQDQHLIHAFRNLGTHARLQHVQHILEQMRYSGTERAEAASLLLEAGKTELAIQLLRETILDFRTDDKEFLDLDDPGEQREGERESDTEYTVADEIAEEIITPFIDRNPLLVARILPQLHLTPDEHRLFSIAARDLARDQGDIYDTSENKVTPEISTHIHQGIQTPNTTFPQPATIAEAASWNEYQENLQKIKAYDTLLQQLARTAPHRRGNRPRIES